MSLSAAPALPTPTPAALGYRMPAEWAPHRGTWLSWPHNEESWPGKFEPIPALFAELVGHLAAGEEVHINVADEAMAREVSARLARQAVAPASVFLHRHPTNDAWCRDHGPVFVQRPLEGRPGEREELILDWGYNAWGGKYPPFDLDDAIPTAIGRELGIPVARPGIVLEGGSIEVNGEGLLLTTESCLLHPNRNPHLTKVEIEVYLRAFLGATTILWLGQGIEGDDTDGHVDDLARFVNPGTVVTVEETDPRDPNFEPLCANRARLEAMTDPNGRPLEVVPLPMPPPLHHQGQRLPASYANFYIGNRVVLLPAYDAPADEVARATLQRLFPSRAVVPINCADLVWGFGAVHCVTQQWPR